MRAVQRAALCANVIHPLAWPARVKLRVRRRCRGHTSLSLLPPHPASSFVTLFRIVYTHARAYICVCRCPPRLRSRAANYPKRKLIVFACPRVRITLIFPRRPREGERAIYYKISIYLYKH